MLRIVGMLQRLFSVFAILLLLPPRLLSLFLIPRVRRTWNIVRWFRILCRGELRTSRNISRGLRELFILGEDYVSMVACEDEIDVALLSSLREAGTTGRQSGELAVQLDVDHRDVSRRIQRMNKRIEQEIGENIIEKHGHRWELIPRLRRDFTATGR